MFNRYSARKVRDTLRIFIAYCSHVIKDNESKQKGSVATIKRDFQNNKAANIGNYIDIYLKHAAAVAAGREMESAARYLSENADAIKTSKPSPEYQRNLDFLSAVAKQLRQQSLNESLEIISAKAGPSKNAVTLSPEVKRFLNGSTADVQTRLETWISIAQSLNIPPNFVQTAINQCPSLRDGSQPVPAFPAGYPPPQHPGMYMPPQPQPGMYMPPQPQPGMYMPQQQPGMYMPPQQPGMYPPPPGMQSMPMQPPQQPYYQPGMPPPPPGMMSAPPPMYYMQQGLSPTQAPPGAALQQVRPGVQTPPNLNQPHDDSNPYSDLK